MRDDGHPEKQLLQLESASFQAFGTGKSTGGSNHAVQGIPFEVSVARLSLAERKDISGYRQEDVILISDRVGIILELWYNTLG